MGVNFAGTTKFKLPKAFRLNGRELRITAPDEIGLAYDFINLVLDDEYGLKRLRKAPATVLDVGANIGMFSMMAGALFPNARIHAYEPNPRIHSYVSSNVAQVGATLFPEAVGAETGTVQMCNSGDSRSGFTTAGGDIRVTAIADAVQRLGGSVDLLKLDCEGAEWEIFKHPKIFKNIAAIRMEYHLIGGQELKNLKNHIEQIGFGITKLEQNDGFGIAWLDRRSDDRL